MLYVVGLSLGIYLGRKYKMTTKEKNKQWEKIEEELAIQKIAFDILNLDLKIVIKKFNSEKNKNLETFLE